MERLPEELILHITSFLESPLDIVKLQYVCRRFLTITRDDTLWRTQCFEHSSFLENLRRRRELATAPAQESSLRESIQRALANENGTTGGPSSEHVVPAAQFEANNLRSRANERIRIMANWEPAYENENVDYYSEYIQRHGPISVGWLQQPRSLDISTEQQPLESRGIALYHPPGDDEETHAIAPLDDGSVCIWDISGKSGSKGRIIGRSRPGVLSVQGEGSRSKMVSTGVTDCISVDSIKKRIYVAVQSSLIEVDLETLQVVAQEQFPYSISALSEAKHPTPITIGTNLSLHLHDSRVSLGQQSSTSDDRVDPVSLSRGDIRLRDFKRLFSPEPSIFASLFHPGPLSILHMPTSAENWDGNGDIYVAGRFPSILNYDRRYFPKLRGTIHSGARLCSMVSLPCPFSALDKDLMRRSELSSDQVQASKELTGSTLIACGEYNSKGSLELYGLSPNPDLTNISSDSRAGRTHNSTLKNRQTSSSSKLLSVSNHGTRLAFSDGGGSIKWVERDGVTEVRRWNIAHGSVEAPRGIFGTVGDSFMDSGSGDIALKILNTKVPGASRTVNTDNLVIWTGDKLGLLSFSPKPGFTSESFEESAKSAEEARREREERIYGETMRRALVTQADEVRFMRGMGLGLGGSS